MRDRMSHGDNIVRSHSGPALAGRRISSGDILYTDWMAVTGDCLLLRAQCIVNSGGGTVDITPQTRGDEGSTVTTVTATGSALVLNSQGFASAAYLATNSTALGNGLQRQVRFKVATSGTWADGSYMVIRLLPPIMFDSAQ
ncbi:MAG: hypothetical protein AB7I19_14555 [Planctomycetota bacterium]